MLSRNSFHRARPACVLVALAQLLSACGGGADTPAPTTPVTPVTPVTPITPIPTSLVALAGDAQSSTPGAALPVKPVVAVRDAAGAGVPGITVTFSVDSGSGTVASATVTTGTDGSASAGDWRLGITEGRNVVTARAGTLAAVKFVATAQVATVNVAGQNVPTTGGTVTLMQSGSTLNGTTLTIAAGALSAAGTVGFTISSAVAIALPPGMSAVTPALTISGPTGILKQPAALRLPVATPAGKVLLVLAQDPAAGTFTVLPSSAKSATDVTVSLASIDVASRAASAANASSAATIRAVDPIIISVAIDPALLAPDFDSNFRPGIDDWDFQRQLISYFPEVSGGFAVDPGLPMIATSLWYYVNRKALGGKLNAKYQEAAGIPESNRRGLRWSSLASNGLPNLYGPAGLADRTRAATVASPGPQSQQAMYELKAAFLLSSNKPQPIFVFTANNFVVDTEPRYGIAYRTVGSAVDLAIPDAPGQTFRITLSPTGWAPASVTTGSGVTYTVNVIAPIQYAVLVHDAALVSQFPLVTAGTIGEAQGWPKPTLVSKFGELDTANVFLVDTLLHWWECSSCVDHGFRSTAVTPTPTKLVPYRAATQAADLSWGALEERTFPANNASLNFLGGSAARKRGSAIYQAAPGSGVNLATFRAWLDWVTVTYKKLPVDLRADSVLIFADSTVAYTVTTTGAPAGVTYRWNYKGKTVRDSADVTIPSFSRRMTERGRTMMYATVLEKTSKRPIGRDSSEVLYARAWQFKTATLTSSVLPAGGIGSQRSDTLGLQLITRWLAELQTAPNNGLLYLYTDPTKCQALALEHFSDGRISDSLETFDTFRAFLGSNCSDPDFTSSFAIGTPGVGTVIGTVSATNSDPDTIVIPGGSINAIMNANALTGSFVWKFRYSTGIALYTINFVARVYVPK